MNNFLKYDPEDIESLLLHKQFHELYPEEKEFVLRHLEGEAEYESLRRTLFELHDVSKTDEWLEPDASLKRELMREFASERRRGFSIWLNNLFAAPEIPWFRQKGYALALGTLALLVGLTFLFLPKTNTQLAENKQPREKEITQPDTAALASLENKDSQAIDVPTTMPPAPEVLLMQNETILEEPASVPAPAAAMADESDNLSVVDFATTATEELSNDNAETKEDLAATTTGKSFEPTAPSASNAFENEKVILAKSSANTTMKFPAQSQNAAQLNDLLSELYTAK
jgi:hypothetical protein